MAGKYNNIKVVFLPKNTTSSPQPLDAGIIQSFEVKYRKKLLCHVLARISNDCNAFDVVKVDILQAITWAAAAPKEVSEMTIKNCFAKCGTVQQVAEKDEADLNKEFA